MADDTKLLFVPVGSNPARPFGMDARDRACRLATNAGFDCADAPDKGRAALISSLAYCWDPAWLKAMRSRPGVVLTLEGKPVLAHVPADGDASAALAALEAGKLLDGYEALASETAELSYAELRKRDRPFVIPPIPSRSSAPLMTPRTRA